MDRPLFPEGVEVHQSALEAGTESQAFHIQRRMADVTRPGRVSGLAVTISTTPTRFNVSGGWGYTARGDYVESDGTTNLQLADYSLGTENLIVACYRESPDTDSYEAYEDGGSTRATHVSRSCELKCMTRAEYDALVEFSDTDRESFEADVKEADVSLDSRRRMIILATVLGQGIGVGFSGVPATVTDAATGNFADGTISQQPLLIPILTASMPSSPTVTGVNIKSVSGNTRVGESRLQINGSYPGERRLSWCSPDANGQSVNPSGAAGVPFNYDTTLPKVLTISSETPGETDCTITVEVFLDFIPRNAPYVDVVPISYLYEDDGAVFTTIDTLHRDKLGSYIPRQDDPHGIGYPDLAQPVSVIPKPVMIGTELLGTEADTLVARIATNRPESAALTERTCIWQSAGGDLGTIRAYALSTAGYELTINAYWTGFDWTNDALGKSMLWRWENDGGFTEYRRPSSYPVGTSWSDSAWDDALMPNKGWLTLGVGRTSTSSDTQTARLRVDRGGGGPSSGTQRTLLFYSEASSGTNIPIRIYLVQASNAENHPHLEFVINADWDGYNYWSRDYGSSDAVRVAVSYTGFRVCVHTGTSPWTDALDDTNWKCVFWVGKNESGNYIHGELTVQKKLIVGTLQTSTTEPRIQTHGHGTIRTLVHEHITSSVPYRKYFAMLDNNYVLEEALAVRWNEESSVWVAEGYTPTLFRYTNGGLQTYRKTGMTHGATFADTNWGPDEPVITLSNEVNTATTLMTPLRLSGGVPYMLGNTLYGANIPKAWGVFQGHTLIAGFNVAGNATVSPVDANLARVSFIAPLGGSSYVVMAQLMDNVYPSETLGAWAYDVLRIPAVVERSSTSFDIYGVTLIDYNLEENNNKVQLINLMSPIYYWSFVVFGASG